MGPSPSEVKFKKKSAFSCQNCRERKVKCAGQHPRCSRCIARNEACIYKLSPTLSYTQKLEARIKELERALPESRANQSPSFLSVSDQSPQNRVSGEFELNGRRAITYQSSTSFFEPANGYLAAAPALEESFASRRERLVQNAWKQRSLEILAETPEPFHSMLSNHWCWIQPLFNFIYRPAFTRDMQTLGPYYSHTLLNAILAHSSRWCQRQPDIAPLLEPYEHGDLFSRHARTLLFEEIQERKRTVPMVQTLLVLSAQECGAGNRTQAWLYSGMAFRLIQDMGICVDNNIHAAQENLTEEDVEIRNRLFWSCYFWDKMISLYLGRSPTIPYTKISPPQMLFDDSAEDDFWVPHGVSYPTGEEYPAMKSHATSSFTQVCRLAVIFDQILLYMYDPARDYPALDRQQCLEDQGSALSAWWNGLPQHLRIDPGSVPKYAPPCHIVTLNCLFHTFSILLYRPMLFGSTSMQLDIAQETEYLKKCIASANSIVIIYDLFCRTFGHGRVILSLSYSVYIASSIFLLQIQASDELDAQVARRLKFCITALGHAKESAPVLKSALDLLLREISKCHQLDLTSISASVDEQGTTTKADDGPDGTQENDFWLHVAFPNLSPGLREFDFSDVQVDPSQLEAFLGLEPISVQVGTLDGLW